MRSVFYKFIDMSQPLKATCPHCQNVDIIPATFVEKHSAQSIVVKCKSCRQSYRQQLPDSTNRHTRIDVDRLSAYRTSEIYMLTIDYKGQLSTYPLQLGENAIGREALADRDIQIDPTLSRVHFYITVQNVSDGVYEYIIKDAGSANKLRLNHKKETIGDERTFFLKSDDSLIAGETLFELQPDISAR